MSARPPYIVGFGGTTRPNSSSERALRVALDHAAALGAETTLFTGDELVTLPHYEPGDPARGEIAERFIAELRRADGIIVASPAYHGSVSGMLKNALDYVEDMRGDARVYFEGRSMGVIVTGYGWQAIVSTINQLRTIAHALRAWITPLGAGINSSDGPIAADGTIADDKVRFQLETVAEEVVDFARRRDAAGDGMAAAAAAEQLPDAAGDAGAGSESEAALPA